MQDDANIFPTITFLGGLDNVDDSASHMRNIQNTNFNQFIANLRMKPMTRSHLNTLLCRLLPLVRPILKTDVQLLENELVNGYHECNMVFYVSIMNNKGRVEPVTHSTYNPWTNSGKYIIIHVSCI